MTKKYLLIILSLSLVTRFIFFSHPAETVFDEVHFGKFVSGYFTGEYFFDIHPPLGKLIVTGVAKIAGFQPGFSFKNIGQKYPDETFKWLRFLPKLAGALLPVVIFLIALELGISQKFAFLAGLLLVFENSLIVQSRFILLDSFLLLFGFSAILFFLKSGIPNLKRSPENQNNKKYLFLSGLFSSLAFSVKWTGFSFLALILLFYFLSPVVNRALRGSATGAGLRSHSLKGMVFLILIPFIIYFSIFAIHFSLLDKSGPGLAFHPPDFPQMNLFSKFIELNAEIYQSNARLTASHPYSSQWYTWPLMIRPVYYWNGPSSAEASGGTVARIYFLGNPLIYWLSTVAVIYFLINFLKLKGSAYYPEPEPPRTIAPGELRGRSARYGAGFLLTAYFLNWFPFIFIGRVMFLYHYLTSLVFAVLILAYSLYKADFGQKKLAFNAILIGSIILFLFFSPLTYGLPIPEWYYKLMVWLPSWR